MSELESKVAMARPPVFKVVKAMGTPVVRSMLAVTTMAFVAGCAALSTQTAEDTVKARANERWAALLKYDYDAAYAYMSPGYRGVTPIEKFKARQGSAVRWAGAEAISVNCPEAVKCVVQVRIQAKPFLGRKFGDTITTHVEETWLLEDGQWWLFQKI